MTNANDRYVKAENGEVFVHKFVEGESIDNFKLFFLSYFSINYEHFGAYPAAFMLSFPKHPFFISEGF